MKRRSYKTEIFAIEELFVVFTDKGNFVGGILNYDKKKNFLVGEFDAKEHGNFYVTGKNKNELAVNGTALVNIQENLENLDHRYDYFFNQKIEYN